MALAWPLVFGLVLALALGGSLRRIADVKLRSLWLIFAALAIQVVAFPFDWLPWATSSVSTRLWLASYVLLTIAMLRNISVPGVALVFVGMASNLAAIVANSDRMPALPSALHAAGLGFSVNRNSVRSGHPHLAWLVDRWAAPGWIPHANVYSVGDVLIAAGAVLFALSATGALDRLRRRRRERSTAVRAAVSE